MSQHTAVSSGPRVGRPRGRAGVVPVGRGGGRRAGCRNTQPGPAANATCLSVSGLSLFGGSAYTSTFGDIAVGIGKNTSASATGGLFGSAFAVGTDDQSITTGAVLA